MCESMFMLHIQTMNSEARNIRVALISAHKLCVAHMMRIHV